MTGPSLENKNLVKKIDAFALVNFLLHGFRECTGRALPFTYLDTLTSILPNFHSISKTLPRGPFANGEEEHSTEASHVSIEL